MSSQDYDVRNPFAGIDEYNCFGCDPDNAIGLHLHFHRDGDKVTTQFEPRTDLQGYPGVVHGGIQATLADEIGGWYVYAVLETAGVTKELTIAYDAPARIEDGPFTVVARAVDRSPKAATIEVEMRNVRDERCARAKVTYALFSEAVARKRLFFPGAEAFRP